MDAMRLTWWLFSRTEDWSMQIESTQIGWARADRSRESWSRAAWQLRVRRMDLRGGAVPELLLIPAGTLGDWYSQA